MVQPNTTDKTALERFLYGSLPAAMESSSTGYANLLGATQARRNDVADRYALARQGLAETNRQATGNINQAYGAAANRVQGAPTFYQRPTSVSPSMAAPMVGADAATMSALATQAGADAGARQGSTDFMYNMLQQSDAANRASRLSDIDLARSSDLGALAALSSAQQFGLGQAEAADLATVDQLFADIEQRRIAADLGLLTTELTTAQQAGQADRAAIDSAIASFSQMITPIVDLLDPVTVIEMWTEFAGRLGIPASQAMGAVA